MSTMSMIVAWIIQKCWPPRHKVTKNMKHKIIMVCKLSFSFVFLCVISASLRGFCFCIVKVSKSMAYSVPALTL